MLTYKLKLNPNKADFLLIGNERQRSKYLSTFPIELFGIKTNPENMLEILSFRSHIPAICSSCCYHIWDLWHIHHHRDLNSAKLLATALASSRFDYCNSLLYGVTDTDRTELQRITNRLTRVVSKSPPFTRSVPLLRSLHWSPVKFRILFKITLLTYKTPWKAACLSLLHAPSLRSNKIINLLVPSVEINTGARAFHSRALSLWNNLLLPVQSVIFGFYLQETAQDTSLWLTCTP